MSAYLDLQSGLKGQYSYACYSCPQQSPSNLVLPSEEAGPKVREAMKLEAFHAHQVIENEVKELSTVH